MCAQQTHHVNFMPLYSLQIWATNVEQQLHEAVMIVFLCRREASAGQIRKLRSLDAAPTVTSHSTMLSSLKVLYT